MTKRGAPLWMLALSVGLSAAPAALADVWQPLSTAE